MFVTLKAASMQLYTVFRKSKKERPFSFPSICYKSYCHWLHLDEVHLNFVNRSQYLMRKTTWKVTYYNKPMFIHPQNQLKSPKWKNRTGGKDMARRKKKNTCRTTVHFMSSSIQWVTFGVRGAWRKKRKLL